MVTTTTKEFIEHETANRLFHLHIDQTKTHLKNVSETIAGVISTRAREEKTRIVRYSDCTRFDAQTALSRLRWRFHMQNSFRFLILKPGHNRDLEEVSAAD